jgi:hypothetical protein
MDQLSSYDEEEIMRKKKDKTDDTGKQDTFRIMRPLGKLHNIIVHIRQSAGRTKEFKDLAGRMVPLDNRTRWNSWFHILYIALKLDTAINNYTKKHFDTLKAEYLSLTNWKKLRTTSKFLNLFDRATLKTQKDQATIDNVLFVINVIIKHFKQALISLFFLK